MYLYAHVILVRDISCKGRGVDIYVHNVCVDLSRRSWSPATTGPSGPSAANYVAVDGLPGPSMAAMDGPLCRKWSPYGKQEKQWLQLQIDLYSYTDK